MTVTIVTLKEESQISDAVRFVYNKSFFDKAVV